MWHHAGFSFLEKCPNEQCITEMLSEVMFSSWDGLKTKKFLSHSNSQDQETHKQTHPQITWREVNDTLFLQSCFIACQENIFGRWTDKEETFVVSIWATADLWALLAFSDIKSKLCERWWRCSNRNGEWKWANRRSCSIKTQNDNQNKWDYQCTSGRKSARNICSGEAEIKRIIRLWSCAFGKSLWKIWCSFSSFAHMEWSYTTFVLSLKLGFVTVTVMPSKKHRFAAKMQLAIHCRLRKI